MSNKIIIGCDHAAFEAKNQLIKYLEKKDYEVCDIGTYTADSCDYPIIAHDLCSRIQSGEFERGILLCGTGIGMSIAANKHAGIRAALCHNQLTASLTREHNNANVLCLGARMIGLELIYAITDTFLTTDALSTDRHVRRQQQLDSLEQELSKKSENN